MIHALSVVSGCASASEEVCQMGDPTNETTFPVVTGH